MSSFWRGPHSYKCRIAEFVPQSLVIALVLLGSGGVPPPVLIGARAFASALAELLKVPTERLVHEHIAAINLLCAEGLPGAENLDLAKNLSTLDTWAQRVKAESERHLHRFRQNPPEYEHSEGFFRMLMLAVVLAEDFGIHYKREGRIDPAQASEHDGFFATAADVFLLGLLGPKRQGTCSSLPVLYVAVGRRLGYPLKLVTTKGHLFVRWDDAKERFNVEAAGEGLNRLEDGYYRQWPFKLTEEEVEAEGYLKSLTPAEELAAFVSIRGRCLQVAGRTAEAAEAFAAASRLALACRGYRLMRAALQRSASSRSPPATVSTMNNQRKD